MTQQQKTITARVSGRCVSPSHISYIGVHARLRRRRGRAAEFRCVGCGDRALDWSYDNADPDELTDAAGRRYSTDLARYQPRCAQCHSSYDSAARRYVTAEPGGAR